MKTVRRIHILILGIKVIMCSTGWTMMWTWGMQIQSWEKYNFKCHVPAIGGKHTHKFSQHSVHHLFISFNNNTSHWGGLHCGFLTRRRLMENKRIIQKMTICSCPWSTCAHNFSFWQNYHSFLASTQTSWNRSGYWTQCLAVKISKVHFVGNKSEDVHWTTVIVPAILSFIKKNLLVEYI